MKKIVFSLLILTILGGCAGSKFSGLQKFDFPQDLKNRMVYLSYLGGSEYIWCHGVAVDEHTIFTATHCINFDRLSELKFVTFGGQRFAPSNLEVLYEGKETNLAILQTKRPIKNINGLIKYKKLRYVKKYPVAFVNSQYQELCKSDGFYKSRNLYGREVSFINQIGIDCYLGKNFSGTPIFISDENEWYLVGISSMRYCDNSEGYCTRTTSQGGAASSLVNVPFDVEKKLLEYHNKTDAN